MRKWAKGLAAFALVLTIFPIGTVRAEEELTLDGESAILIDADSGAVLYEKMRMNGIILPASPRL